ncbi:MAG: hypothetical protein ACXAB2_01150 [Candidatus Hodarchaeales archaeon]|jgi:hypothetical protein
MKSEVNLSFYLDEYYKNDEVVIWIDNKVVYQEEGVTTDLSNSLANQFSILVEKKTIDIRCEILTRNLSETMTLEVKGDVHLRVKVFDDRILFLEEKEPPIFF